MLNNVWVFKGKKISENYITEEEQSVLDVKKVPRDIMKMCNNKKRMYFLLSNQLGIVLPHKDSCTKQFMWSCLIGLKKYMTPGGKFNGLTYKKHNPGFVIKENGIKYWCDHLNMFSGWELYIPDPYIAKIKKEAKKSSVDQRDYIPFDTKYLLSVFKSLDEDAYSAILRSKFDLRQRRLKARAREPPMMI